MAKSQTADPEQHVALEVRLQLQVSLIDAQTLEGALRSGATAINVPAETSSGVMILNGEPVARVSVVEQLLLLSIEELIE